MFQLLHASVSVFQSIVSLVSVDVSSHYFNCFEKLEYLYHMQMNVLTHQNTLDTFRMLLGTMFMKVISSNYASKY
jgi:hypothetical protein